MGIVKHRSWSTGLAETFDHEIRLIKILTGVVVRDGNETRYTGRARREKAIARVLDGYGRVRRDT